MQLGYPSAMASGFVFSFFVEKEKKGIT